MKVFKNFSRMVPLGLSKTSLANMLLATPYHSDFPMLRAVVNCCVCIKVARMTKTFCDDLTQRGPWRCNNMCALLCNEVCLMKATSVPHACDFDTPPPDEPDPRVHLAGTC